MDLMYLKEEELIHERDALTYSSYLCKPAGIFMGEQMQIGGHFQMHCAIRKNLNMPLYDYICVAITPVKDVPDFVHYPRAIWHFQRKRKASQ